MSSKIFIILAVFLLTLVSACSKSGAADQTANASTAGDTQAKTEVYIDESDFQNQPEQITTTTTQSQGDSRLLSDKSKVTTAFDGYGNKSETRYFENDPRLRFVLVRTSRDGVKEVTVYGHDSDTKMVNELGDRALTASSQEIASAAGMTATKTYREVRNYLKPSNASSSGSLQPLPSSEFPVTAPQPVSSEPAPPNPPSVEKETSGQTPNQTQPVSVPQLPPAPQP